MLSVNATGRSAISSTERMPLPPHRRSSRGGCLGARGVLRYEQQGNRVGVAPMMFVCLGYDLECHPPQGGTQITKEKRPCDAGACKAFSQTPLLSLRQTRGAQSAPPVAP